MKKINSFIYNNFNLPKKVCNHIIGKEHSQTHRVVVGSTIMVIGVIIAQVPIINTFTVHVMSETVGFLLHCIGAIPIVQSIEKLFKHEQ